MEGDLSSMYSQLPMFFCGSDIVALPSFSEGLGIVLLEAGAAGKPVVASDIRGIDEVVIDGETGILVPPQDPKALATAILQLLEDAQMRNRLGAAARRSVKDRFSLSESVDRLLEVYESLL